MQNQRPHQHPIRDAITNAPAFKRWFGESKVVDADGNPLVVYHGSKRNFRIFEEQFNANEPGFFFTESENYAKSYGQKIKKVFLSLKNPYYAEEDGFTPAEAKDAGYDGYIVEGHMNSTTYVAFSANQIKSATGNNGDYSIFNADICR